MIGEGGGILNIRGERSIALLTILQRNCKGYTKSFRSRADWERERKTTKLGNMNYFAHGMRFVDRPYFLAGTALPDWLSVVDRRVRLRARHVLPFADGNNSPIAELAAGVLQHLDDDAWFHKTAAFAVASAELTIVFRDALPTDDGHRPAFLGHILTEMLLDEVLIDRDPAALDSYYAALDRLDAGIVADAVIRMVPPTTARMHLSQTICCLRPFILLFANERFLADYRDSSLLLIRLNQIMRRVKLKPLPESFKTSLETARTIVIRHAAELLAGWESISGD